MKAEELTGSWIEPALQRLTEEVLASLAPKDDLAIVGIRTRGAFLAARLQKRFTDAGRSCELGELDVTLYRDDIHGGGGRKPIQASRLDFDLSGKTVLLVDDVLYTGRTIRAALSELMDFGRPAVVRLLCLLDRGGQELPIRADFVADTVEVPTGRKLQVSLREKDGEDRIEVL
ncbi:MAG: bifunctional pyr operon transcriptional regulator/uracil phosphoribosyltransferase PyrR [Planctomycetota bacterium]|jgi:pyrimidine operon attenuation protein/uracil phosphoribosyltransferase